MSVIRLIAAAGLGVAALAPANAADDKSPARQAWEHCRAALEAERPDADLDITRHSERGTNTYRFHVNAHEGGETERFTCTAHADRGVMTIQMLRT